MVVFPAGELSFLIAPLIPAALALFGVRAGILTRGGGVAAFIVGLVVILFAGPLMFIPLVVMVGLGEGATRVRIALDARRARSGSLGAFKPLALHKPRSEHSVISNGGVAAILALALGVTRAFAPDAGMAYEALLILAIAGSLAAAAGDTVAGEIGRAFRAPAILITTFKPVPVGTNGGVSNIGSLAGAIASMIIALLAWAALGGARSVVPVAVFLGGALGNTADSLLGATVEGRTLRIGILKMKIGNHAVNFACTLIGAAVSAPFYVLV